MMERHAIWKAKKEAEEKVFAEERARVMAFDKGKLAKHLALVEFEQKTRQALDDAAAKLNGKFGAAMRGTFSSRSRRPSKPILKAYAQWIPKAVIRPSRGTTMSS